MGDLVFNCSHCAQQLIVDARGVGLEVPCPHCHQPIVIPPDAMPVEDFQGPIREAGPEPPEPEMLDGTADERRTLQMLDLLKEVVGDTARVESGIAALSATPAREPSPAGDASSELPGNDAIEILSGGLSLLKTKLGQMTSEVETAGQRIRELTLLSNSLKAQISEGEADKRRLKEEISELTKTSSQRIDLAEAAPPPVTPAVLHLEETPTEPSSLPSSIWRSRGFQLLFAILASLTAGAGYVFHTMHLPEVVTVMPRLEPDAHNRDNLPEIEVGGTTAFGPARVQFAAPYEDTAESALLGEVPADLADNRFLVLPVTLTNTSASQPIYLKYLWADVELVSAQGHQIKPVHLGTSAMDTGSAASAQIMEPGSAIAVNLVFAIPNSRQTEVELHVMPGIWIRGVGGELACQGRHVRVKLPDLKDRAVTP